MLSSFTMDNLSVPARLWIKHKDTYYSQHPTVGGGFLTDRNIYVHNYGNRGEFYGTYEDSELEFIVNPSPTISKVFDNLIVNIDNSGYLRLTSVTMNTETQSQSLSPQSDTRGKYREYLYKIPLRSLTQSDRMRGKHLALKFVFNNNGNLIRVTNVESLYRPSRKI